MADPVLALRQEIDRCTFALGVALVASVGHFNPASLIFAALLLLSSKEEPASRKGKTQHWVLRPRTTRFVWAVLVCDLLLLPSVVFLFVACHEMKSLLTTYVPEDSYGKASGSGNWREESLKRSDSITFENAYDLCNETMFPLKGDQPLGSAFGAGANGTTCAMFRVIEYLEHSSNARFVSVDPDSWLPDVFTLDTKEYSVGPDRGSEYSAPSVDRLLASLNLITAVFGALVLMTTLVSVISVAATLVLLRRARAMAPLALCIHVRADAVSGEEAGAGGTSAGGGLLPLQTAVREVVSSLVGEEGHDEGQNKFEVNKLISGRAVDAALGVLKYLDVPAEREVYLGLADGLDAIVREFEAHGTKDDRECLEYLLHGRTGDLPRRWPNGVMDEGRPAGLSLDDFVAHPHSRLAGLSPAHVAALRLYTCNCFRSLNGPLRRHVDGIPYPFPVTLLLIAEAIRLLRAVGAARSDANEPMDVWRGMKNLELTEGFATKGGTEVAPMSTTTDLRVAVSYSVGFSPAGASRALLFKLRAESFMDRGADLTFLSCFPGEAEMCFPPLTYLAPSGRREVFVVEGVEFEVIEVEPKFGS